MIRYSFALVALISLVFVACNKDEDIITNDPGSSPETPEVSLGYQVLEYTPAPGQYINEVANGSSDIHTAQDACRYAEERFKASRFVSLGAWGGYIIVKFDSSVENSGGYDFAISSNAFDTSNEPGIVWVMQDSNGNGAPDEEWFELKGSFFGQEGFQRDFWVTYTRPQPRENTPWTDKNGNSGYIMWMGSYHSQEFYYPQWITEDSMTFYGSLLPHRASQDDAGIWVNEPFEWGYADNFGEDYIASGMKNQFRISDAVDSSGNPANLSSVDFVKVQTAILNNSGWLGENSTEVCGFFPLH